jgi:hypothetical protein
MISWDLSESAFVSVRKQRGKNALGLLCERASLLAGCTKVGTNSKTGKSACAEEYRRNDIVEVNYLSRNNGVLAQKRQNFYAEDAESAEFTEKRRAG